MNYPDLNSALEDTKDLIALIEKAMLIVEKLNLREPSIVSPNELLTKVTLSWGHTTLGVSQWLLRFSYQGNRDIDLHGKTYYKVHVHTFTSINHIVEHASLLQSVIGVKDET